MDEKFEKLTRSWKKTADPHLPAGMEVEGIARGRKNSFHTIRFLVLTIGFMAMTWLLINHLRDWGLPPSIPVSFPASFVSIITTFLLYYLGNLLGIYPFVMIVWNQNQVVLLERGAFGRSIIRKIIPRPVPGGLTRKDENTVVLGHEKIVLDYPKIVMDVLERSLGDRNAGQAGAGNEAVKPVPTEEKTAPFARGIEVQSDTSPPKSNKLLGVLAILLLVIGGVGCIVFGVGTGFMVSAGIPEASIENYRVISFLLLGAGGVTRIIFLKVKGHREAEDH